MNNEITDESIDETVTQSGSVGKSRRNQIVGIFWALFGVITIFGGAAIQITQGANSELGPKFWPQMLGIFFLVIGIILIIQDFRGKIRDPEQEEITKTGLIEVLGVFVILVLQVIAWGFVGFLPSAAAALILLPLMLGTRKPIKIILFSALTTGLLYGLFAMILRIPL